MAIIKRPVSPRQKMINLMYVILIALLAMNISRDVLDGFNLIGDSLNRTAELTANENNAMYLRMESVFQDNPAKAGKWYRMADELRKASDKICSLTDTLRYMIALEADGEDADPASISDKENMEAAAQVMLSPVKGRGKQLHSALNDYRTLVMSMTEDPLKKEIMSKSLSTKVPEDQQDKNWQQYMFESMPAEAAVAMLTKIKTDIRHAEAMALHSLMSSIDERDFRVNALQAVVIPSSRTVVKGGEIKADILMAAMDTTNTWETYINGKRTELPGGKYTVRATQAGEHTLKGWLQTTDRDGEKLIREFEERFTVIEPMATVSAEMTNVLYAGYENPVSISVPGYASTMTKATMSGGELTEIQPGIYTAVPPQGSETVTINVFATGETGDIPMGEYAFRVRPLPDPMPYITSKDAEGNTKKYRSGTIPKAALASANMLKASVDDGILDIPFTVSSFETVFFDARGNAVPMASDGAAFSSRQKDTFRQLGAGKRFYITRVSVTGPDGQERTLDSSMELIIR